MKKIFITIFILTILFILYGFYINPKQLRVKEQTIESDKLTLGYNNLKIVHFSDLLLGSPTTTDDLDKISIKINEANPDIIFFTGDLIKSNTKLTEEDSEKLIDFLKNLSCNLYKYAIIGDNDQQDIENYKTILTKGDFQLLDNEYTYLFYKDLHPIKIIGITDPNDISKLYSNEEGIEPIYNIAITHQPDNLINLDKEKIDLYLAGHSEGGRINVPFIGRIIKKEGSKTYYESYYKVENTDVYISNGIGTEGSGFRIFNTPTINVYKLKSQK